jgi:hypothetical protein
MALASQEYQSNYHFKKSSCSCSWVTLSHFRITAPLKTDAASAVQLNHTFHQLAATKPLTRKTAMKFRFCVFFNSSILCKGIFKHHELIKCIALLQGIDQQHYFNLCIWYTFSLGVSETNGGILSPSRRHSRHLEYMILNF